MNRVVQQFVPANLQHTEGLQRFVASMSSMPEVSEPNTPAPSTAPSHAPAAPDIAMEHDHIKQEAKPTRRMLSMRRPSCYASVD